ncbi:glycoside hydrolase family 5 [Priestia megaterium]|uniref:glycoside hydrolase family 5 n=1 Tax=Priestia megaterium TaxID=1404 RepID=UPI003F801BB9
MTVKKITILIILALVIIASVQILKPSKQTYQYNKNLSTLINTIPNNIGVQTHVASEVNDVDVNLIKDNGFRIVRDDILWNLVEKKPGEYDFVNNGYDTFNKKLINNGIRPYHILSYSNVNYEKDNSVVTEKGLKAYTKFAGIAADRYKNQNGIWEIWNEPNSARFWTPTFSSIDKYTELVASSAAVIRKNDPTGIVVAPALATIDNYSLDWLEGTFRKGLLDHIDALSVHLYRATPPETVREDYNKIRELVKKYTDRDIPILSGEWGYSTGQAFYGAQFNQRQQAQYLVRMFLINMYEEVPINIWYDWKNDGEDLADGEYNFGIREYDGTTPKEAAYAAKALTTILSGYHFVQRIETSSENDYILRFTNDKKEVVYAYWTQDNEHSINVDKVHHFKGQELSMFGEYTQKIDTKKNPLFLSNSPAYVKASK